MTGKSWVSAIDEENLCEGRMTAVYPKGLSIMLVKKSGEIYAVSNRCAHMGCLLTAGQLFGNIVQCACHDWQFDIRTGESTDAPEIKIPVYESKRENGRIAINIGAEANA